MRYRRETLSQRGGTASGERFRELRAFLSQLDAVLEDGEQPAERVHTVKQRLADLIGRSPELPAEVRATSGDHYARHLLYADPGDRYEIVVMAWSPGQATPIHDHSGIWCVEGVVEGRIDVTRYDLKEMVSEGVARMQATEVIRAGLGQCGALIPPVEYHKIANPYDQPAFTIHVYGGRMRTCRVFERRADDTYQVRLQPLGFNSPDAALSAL